MEWSKTMRDKGNTRINGAQPPRSSTRLPRLRDVVTNLRRVREDPDANDELAGVADELAAELEEASGGR